MIRLEHMQEFVALAQRLSFTEAAEALYVAQPSLSRHIARMEAELGFELLHRNTRQVRLTPAGETLFAAFSQILKTYGEAVELAKVYGEGYSGKLRVGSPRFLAEELMEDRALNFSRRYPETKLELRILHPEQALLALQAGEVDLIVCLQQDSIVPGLCFRTIASEPLHVLMSADHPLAEQKAVTLSQLRGEHFLFLGRGDQPSPFRQFIQPQLEQQGVAPEQLIQVERFDDLGVTIRQTGAVSILLRRTGNIGRDQLRSLPIADPACTVDLCFSWRSGDENPAIPLFCALEEAE